MKVMEGRKEEEGWKIKEGCVFTGGRGVLSTLRFLGERKEGRVGGWSTFEAKKTKKEEN